MLHKWATRAEDHATLRWVNQWADKLDEHLISWFVKSNSSCTATSQAHNCVAPNSTNDPYSFSNAQWKVQSDDHLLDRLTVATQQTLPDRQKLLHIFSPKCNTGYPFHFWYLSDFAVAYGYHLVMQKVWWRLNFNLGLWHGVGQDFFKFV